MASSLSSLPIGRVKGIGPSRAELLGRLGIKTVQDLLYHLPYRYEDRRNIGKICEIAEGRVQTIKGSVISSVLRRPPRARGLTVFELAVTDGTAVVKCIWFNQPFMKKNFRVGDEILLSGLVRRSARHGGFELDSPEYEIVSGVPDTLVHADRIVPLYSVPEGISRKQYRKIVFSVIEGLCGKITDPLPDDVRERHSLPGLYESLKHTHFPEKDEETENLNDGSSPWRKRLCFDELFMLALGMAVTRKKRGNERGFSLQCEGKLRRTLLQRLPFTLTSAQNRALGNILEDIGKTHPMHRLLQGDVGCGKTVVAVVALMTAIECGCQTALMAPTEILAEQHYSVIRELTRGLGVRIALLSGSPGKRELERISSGEIELAIGTHALIQEKVSFRNLGLAVIDEQHKFGVLQRTRLKEKGLNPHLLVMTATPIPRSLALTLYGDLDCSVIDELPPKRSPVITEVYSQAQKAMIYRTIEEEITKGRQAYVVYPAIAENDTTGLRSAVQGMRAFQEMFPSFRTALVHGKMRRQEREEVMVLFKKGDIDILISTTVIEVGVDVPNATLMVVVHAERFGLAQLHQLRGRVGRGAEKSRCLLLAYGPLGDEAKRRLDVVADSADGFRIAEEDLLIRGPGEFLGTRQAGMPDLKVSDIVKDVRVLEAARKEAFVLIGRDPELDGYPVLRRCVEEFWRDKVQLFKAG